MLVSFSIIAIFIGNYFAFGTVVVLFFFSIFFSFLAFSCFDFCAAALVGYVDLANLQLPAGG